MAATCVVYDQCPECGIDVPIDVRFTTAGREGDALVVGVESDLTDVMAHAWTHE